MIATASMNVFVLLLFRMER